MLENLYTTKMSTEKKQLQSRFTKIRSSSGKLSKIVASLVAGVILITFICASIVMAMFDGVQKRSNDIKVYCGETILDFKNKPFFRNRTVYIPMTELFEKIGIDDKSKITYDSGNIHIEIEGHQNYYDIAINDNKIVYSYFFAESNNQISETITPYSPVLLNGNVYIPFDYIDWILNRYNDNFDVSYVFSDIDSKVAYKNNAEYMTYPYICDLQFQVDNGHFPWRINPELVISSFMESIGKGGGEITELFGNGINVNATYKIQRDTFIVELFKPVQTDEFGIWIVKKYFKQSVIQDEELTKDDFKENQVKKEEIIKGVNDVSNITTKENINAYVVNDNAVQNISEKKRIKATSITDELFTGIEQIVLSEYDSRTLQEELNSRGITQSQESSVDLRQSYSEKALTSDKTQVIADENGNISLYMSVNGDNLFDVKITDFETNNDVGQYTILANNSNAYSFLGYEQGKIYNVEVLSKTQGDWDITGSYILY